MPDTSSTQLQNNLALLKNMDASTSSSSSTATNDTVARSKNTRDAVDALLQTLLDPGALEQIRSAARKNNTTPALPTYNVRTPIVEMYLNGFPIFPNAKDGNRAHFEELNISFPISGVEGTVTGTVKLYAKDPGLIIEALDKSSSSDSSNPPSAAATPPSTTASAYDKTSQDGLPLLQMRWGWSFATQKDGDSGSGVKKVWTPMMNFLVMNVEISNPEASGTTFNMKLQDIGNTVLQYSSANLVFDPDYPQQQIRTIVEGCLGFRLFTLDDLLNLKAISSGNATSSNPDSANATNTKTFFVNDKLGALRTVGNNFLVVLNGLADQCKCKWYSTQNSDLSKAVTASGESQGKLDQAMSALAQLKNSGTASKEGLTAAQTKVDQYFADMSFGCKLYWIDNVPTDWKTISGNYYISDADMEKGAFFLLPDLSDTTADSLGYISLNYGPGASSFPYLHGSAQNVFNASIHAAGKHSQTFGDVQSVNIQYAPFITMLQSSITENAMYVHDTGYATLEGKIHKVKVDPPVPDGGKVEINQTTGSTAAAQGSVDKANANIATENKRKKKNFRFYNAIGKKNYVEIVDAPAVQGDPIQKQKENIAPGGTYTAMKLRSRVNQFLKWPFRASITVLGDPTLMRLNQGGFELISYYPSQDGKYQNFNPLLSGIYYALQVTHTLTMSDYTTTISGIKNSSAKNVGVLVTKITTATEAEDTAARTAAGTTGKKVDNATGTTSDSLNSQALRVDLSDNSFTQGFLSKSLQNLYIQTQNQAATGNKPGSGTSKPS